MSKVGRAAFLLLHHDLERFRFEREVKKGFTMMRCDVVEKKG